MSIYNAYNVYNICHVYTGMEMVSHGLETRSDLGSNPDSDVYLFMTLETSLFVSPSLQTIQIHFSAYSLTK